MKGVAELFFRASRSLTESQWVALLIARISIGFFFVMSGYNKIFLNGVDSLVDGFRESGIPFPLASAWLNTLAQFVGGFALALGLGTRIWSGIIGFAMIVASITVIIPEVLQNDIANAESSLLFWGWFYYRPEPIYLTVFLLLGFVGPGKASLDHLIAKRWGAG